MKNGAWPKTVIDMLPSQSLLASASALTPTETSIVYFLKYTTCDLLVTIWMHACSYCDRPLLYEGCWVSALCVLIVR